MPVVALAAGTLALAPAATAHATGNTSSSGKATAVVLRTGLDVSLLNNTVDVPLNLSLNDVHAPADAGQTALIAKLDGVDGGKPFSVVRADVATARATADKHKAEGYVNLVNAQVHVPGLPLIGLIKVGTVTSRATCEAGKQPTAESNLLGHVAVLGKRVTVSTGGTTKVTVPGVGEVRLDLSKREVTSRTAAATALELTVSVNPLNLNVAEVNGTVTLAKATCESPKAGSSTGGSSDPSPGTSTGAGSGTGTGTGTKAKAQNVATSEQNLAETGGSSATPYLAAGAAGLLAIGGAVVYAARRRKPATVNVRD
ncbi:SCO1860 family LAETG-anchored protein [Actinacidiphila soli]|jgi:LPXTG-motif cell wall-anchored protein|uniref:SCO1860 family LAETG-anchored protein n=1 Tax=Actinacidiphila soli TaxID=2487275 RepID=UPI000FCABFD8|nr:SCO1860 family LAETG-anchored protein [Actinacidiphila soli]